MIPAGTRDLPLTNAQRRQVFVDTAREAFFADGYAGTTMSSIAARVGGSKTTLWAYFPSKEALFAAVVDNIAEQYGVALLVEFGEDEPFPAALRRLGAAVMKTIFSEPIIELHRLVTGEAGRFPELARMMYESGPKRGKAKLAALIEREMARGVLRKADPLVAARQFAGLLQSGCFQFALLGMEEHPAPEDIERDLENAVETFLRGWMIEGVDNVG